MKYFYVDYPFSSGVGSFDVVCLNILEAYSVAKHVHPEVEPDKISLHTRPITQTIYFSETGAEQLKQRIISIILQSVEVKIGKPIGEQK